MKQVFGACIFGLGFYAPLASQPFEYSDADAAADEAEATAEAAEATAEVLEREAAEANFRAMLRDWRTLFVADQGSVFQVRLGDWLKIEPETSDGQVWVKVDHSRDATVDARSSTFRFRVNCVRFQYQITSSISHDPNGSTMRYPSFHNKYAWTDAIPDTVAAALMESICE